MTDDEIKQARALCEAATLGPWSETESGNTIDEDRFSYVMDANGMSVSRMAWHGQGKRNAAFIAAARTLLPKALDEIERLKAYSKMLADDRLRACDVAEDAGRKAGMRAAAEICREYALALEKNGEQLTKLVAWQAGSRIIDAMGRE